MKRLALLFLVIFVISFVCSEIDGNQDNQINQIEQKNKENPEEVTEEIISQVVKIQELSASLINTCREGFRLTSSGRCVRIL